MTQFGIQIINDVLLTIHVIIVLITAGKLTLFDQKLENDIVEVKKGNLEVTKPKLNRTYLTPADDHRIKFEKDREKIQFHRRKRPNSSLGHRDISVLNSGLREKFSLKFTEV